MQQGGGGYNCDLWLASSSGQSQPSPGRAVDAAALHNPLHSPLLMLLLLPRRASFWMPSPLTLFATRSRIFRTHKSLNKRACRAFIITSVCPGSQAGNQPEWDNQTGGHPSRDPSPLSSACSVKFIAIICNCSAKIEFEVGSPRVRHTHI